MWLYNRANYIELNEKILSFDWNCLFVGTVDEACSLFMSVFMEFVKATIPHKKVTVRPKDKPWYDSEIRKYSRKRDRLKSTAIKTSRQADWEKYKIIRNKVNNLKKHAKELFYNNLELSLQDSFTSNKKDYWKIIRHFVKNNNTSSTIPPLQKTLETGETIYCTSDKEKADCLNSYFTSTSTIDDSNASLPPFFERTNQYLENITITENEVKDILQNLNVNKASGLDMVSNRMLKYTASTVCKPLCIIFNRSIQDGIFPEPWKNSQLVPIHKKGDTTLPSNYRPISLLSNVGKTMERVIYKHIYNHLHSNELLHKYQSGFLPGHSTTYQLIDIYHHICQSFDEKQYSCMVFCDISKAFDRVWHRGLLFKLRQNGIKGKLLDWISDYLSSRKQRVFINSASSFISIITAGVPQGSVLGTLFFLVFVDDISCNLLSLIRLFADDSSLFFTATKIEDIEGIVNHDLAMILAWAKLWLVDFNPNKTEAILFSLRNNSETPNLLFDGTNIKFVDNHKHLGVTLTSSGQWNTHIENVLKSAYKVLGIMRKVKYSFNRQALNQMYISYVRPILEYASILWDGCTVQDKNALEKLQNEAARIVTGLTRSTSLVNLYKECGWDSLADRRHFQKLCFMYKCTSNTVPGYILDLIPPNVRDISNYPLRNSENISSIYTRTERFARSCLPSSISLWNNLESPIKQNDSFPAFRSSLKQHLLSTHEVPDYFVKGKRKLSVLHARIRNNCSDLKSDMYTNHLSNDRVCSCGYENENAEHFFFQCENYTNIRINLFRETRPFHPLSVDYILYGKPTLSNENNFLLFQAVQRYIRETKRFN